MNKIRKVDLRITNAWDKVLYHSKDDRTEGKLNATEIYSTNNINRLNKELNDITDLIICFGYNAKQSLKKLTLKNKPKILFGPHLGLQSINRNKNLKTDITGNTIVRGKNANYLRLQKIAYEL